MRPVCFAAITEIICQCAGSLCIAIGCRIEYNEGIHRMSLLALTEVDPCVAKP